MLTFAVGLAAGVMSGLASMGGPPIVVYLMALSHGAAVVRASSIVYFMIRRTLSLLLMVWKGLIDREILLWSLASVPVLIAGNMSGNWGFHRSRRITIADRAGTLSVLAVLLIAKGP